MTITAPEPGVYDDLDEAIYHQMPGLSATSMKWLLRSPKYYRQRMDHRVHKAAFDLGHAVHAKVLGVGMPIIEIPDDLLAANGAVSTKAAKEFVEQARADGLIPVKAEVAAEVDAIAEAVLANPKAAAVLSIIGETELSLFAADPSTGVPLRGRIDRLATLDTGTRMVVDLKTTTDVRRHKIRRTIEDFAYDIQSEAYRNLVRLTTGQHVAPTVLVFVETEPPHEVRVVQLAHPDWIDGGTRKMRRAINLYAACDFANHWPGDDDDPGEPESLEPRPYYLEDLLDAEAAL